MKPGNLLANITILTGAIMLCFKSNIDECHEQKSDESHADKQRSFAFSSAHGHSSLHVLFLAIAANTVENGLSTVPGKTVILLQVFLYFL